MINTFLQERLRMGKIKLKTISEALIEIEKLQTVCKKYREENKDLKKRLEKFKNLGKGMPGFMKGFK